MALNLTTLTNPATSGDVLAEALTTADFLEGVPVLRNLARGSQKGGDAKQDVALNQPKALPLIKNPSGNLGGYLYIPDVSGNYATGPSVTIGSNETWEGELDMVITQFGSYIMPMGGGDWTAGFGLLFYSDGAIRVFSKGSYGNNVSLGVTFGTSFNLKYGYDGTELYVEKDGVRQNTGTPSSQSSSITHTLQLSQQNNLSSTGNYAIQKAKLTVNSAVVFDCDFNGSTSIRHGDTKWQASVGGPVSLTKAGNDPVTVVKKSVLRFANQSDNTTGICLQGLFNQTITDGYMFAAFSVLGDGGEGWGRVFSVNSTGSSDGSSTGFQFLDKFTTSNDLVLYYNGDSVTHTDLFDENNGDILVESKITSTGIQSKVNDNSPESLTVSTSLSAEEFNISTRHVEGVENPAIDLEYLALFPATITDAQADDVRNYINNRNNVFSLIDSQGYYFFDGAATVNNQVFTGSSSWAGRIVGSDNDDPFKYLSNGSINDRPTTDGYKITFADNIEHFLFNTPLTGGLAGWQIVGTSLGTFAYRVNSDAVTELNLLGNLGGASYRKAGDLYGVILLPESATGKDIEDARKLLIDRGASDGVSVSSAFEFWRQRDDIVEFKGIEFSSVTNLGRAWRNCYDLESFFPINAPNCNNFNQTWNNTNSLTSFPAGAKLGTAANNVNFDSAWQSSGLTSFSTPLPTATSASIAWGYCSSLAQFNLDSLPVVLNVSQAWRNTGLTSFNTNLPSATSVTYTWYRATSLSSFGAVDIKNCSDFTGAWQSCSALTSFPAGAKLGTEANNVNFTSAWRSSGLLTSFSTPLPTATNTSNAWLSCHSLALFNTPLPLSTTVGYAWYDCTSLTSFDTLIPLVTDAQSGWYNCTSLTSFDTLIPLVSYAYRAWGNCTSLTDFSADVFSNWNPSSITSGVFNNTWDGCTSLTAQSVENILTSIDASGKYGTATGAAGGGSIDSGIDIDYDGTTLSAATNAAIDSLSGKGWEVYINGVLVIPNILDLQPAAAYSLRSFDADADPNVVNVRRSSDSALRDFKASEVSDGTLTDWVNTDVDLVTPTLNNGGFEDGSTGWNLSNAAIDTSEFYAGSKSVKLTVTGGAGAFVYKANLQVGSSYRVGFWAKISDASKQMRVEFGSAANKEDINFTSTDWEYKEVTKSATAVGLAFARQSTSGDYTINIDNITITQLTANGHVTTWYDQGGTNHATQTVASSQPKIVDAGTLVTEGGLPALDFDTGNTNSRLTTSAAVKPSNLNNFSLFTVQKATGGNGAFGLLTGGAPDNRLYLPYNQSSVNRFSYGDQIAAVSLGSPPTTHQLLSAIAGSTQGNAQAFIDGDSQGSTALQDIAPTTSSVIFGSGPNNGSMQEVIMFHNDQSANRTGIENNINDHFDIYS